MTVEMAAFYRRMLSVGLSDTYEHDIGLALENEDPLPELLLDLAFCLSDTSKTISILDDYIYGRTLNEYQIYPMVLAEMRELYVSGSLKLEQIVEILFQILEGAGLWYAGPWEKLTYLYFEYEEAEDGWLDMNSYLSSFAKSILTEDERSDNDD